MEAKGELPAMVLRTEEHVGAHTQAVWDSNLEHFCKLVGQAAAEPAPVHNEAAF